MKHIKLVALLALIIGCSQTGSLKVKAIDILPPGGDVDSVTAYVDLQGAGIARLDWENRAYGVDSLVQTEYWYVDSSDVYTSTLSVTDGWYWLSIYDEDSVLLATSDVVFCGTGSQLPPIAKFYAEPTEGLISLRVEFHDQSLNDPTSWRWELEGEYHGIDTMQNPVGYYGEAGIYDVALIVSNIAGTDTLTKENYIHAQLPPPPIADFYAEPTEGKGQFGVYFYDQSLNDPTSWFWDFGDGYTSTEHNPYSHSYSYAADSMLPYWNDTAFTVMLIVTNPGGTDTMVKENYIHYEPGDPPIADFYATPTQGQVPLYVYFSDLSTYWEGTPWDREWYVGEGAPKKWGGGLSHIYYSPGIYTVRLIASDRWGKDTLTKRDYITVTE